MVAFADAYREFALAHPGRYAATQMQLPPEAVAGSQGLVCCGEATYVGTGDHEQPEDRYEDRYEEWHPPRTRRDALLRGARHRTAPAGDPRRRW
ncbi:TetR-like C-terminal domain-containing protein [Streptomyces sp. NBC_01267]|uniref:TetR-like C-terminal domain-containing protein n=1 Tax=Streptomyces sp. NBC_01267 TaxID=2903805 RepID=UPI002E35EA32|nr:TetR-like C-terminal domain-containing protein [Streptomyces sp. NBC_01267]